MSNSDFIINSNQIDSASIIVRTLTYTLLTGSTLLFLNGFYLSSLTLLLSSIIYIVILQAILHRNKLDYINHIIVIVYLLCVITINLLWGYIESPGLIFLFVSPFLAALFVTTSALLVYSFLTVVVCLTFLMMYLFQLPIYITIPTENYNYILFTSYLCASALIAVLAYVCMNTTNVSLKLLHKSEKTLQSRMQAHSRLIHKTNEILESKRKNAVITANILAFMTKVRKIEVANQYMLEKLKDNGDIDLGISYISAQNESKGSYITCYDSDTNYAKPINYLIQKIIKQEALIWVNTANTPLTRITTACQNVYDEKLSYEFKPIYFHDRLVYILFTFKFGKKSTSHNEVLLELLTQIEAIITRFYYEFELLSQREQAMQATKAKSEFLANMSHEIRTPLNGALGLLELLSLTALSDHQKDLIKEISTSSNMLLHIINDILDCSKLDSFNMELEEHEFSLFELVDSIVYMQLQDSLKKSLQIEVNTSPDIPDLLIGDSLRVSQIVSNLLSNAIKFTETTALKQGKITIHSDIEFTDSFQSVVNIYVKDNGIGMTEEQKKVIFSPFYQAEASITRRFGGTGLGLSICKKIIKKLHGKISVSCKPNEGCSFKISLPFKFKIKNLTHYDYSDIRAIHLACNKTNNIQLENYCKKMRVKLKHLSTVDLINSISHYKQAPLLLFIDKENVETTLNLLEQNVSKKTLKRCTFIILKSNLKNSMKKISDNYLELNTTPLSFNAIKNIFKTKHQYLRIDKKTPANAININDNYHILVAEDNEINQKVIQLQLKKLGYHCDVANNGAIAWELAQRSNYDLILTDYHMPQMSGMELTHLIRDKLDDSDKKHIVIGFSANAIKEQIDDALLKGMDYYLVKPIAINKLQQTLEKWL